MVTWLNFDTVDSVSPPVDSLTTEIGTPGRRWCVENATDSGVSSAVLIFPESRVITACPGVVGCGHILDGTLIRFPLAVPGLLVQVPLS